METTVCVAGGGPAGLMLGLLLARAGVDVVVLEKHADFLRDFRGDTVHPSTLQVLDELGLSERFSTLPYQKVEKAGTIVGGEEIVLADFGRLRVPFPYVAMVPQWDFLDLLSDEAGTYPSFRLLMNAEAYDLIRESGRVAGVRVRRRSPDANEEAGAPEKPDPTEKPDHLGDPERRGPEELEIRAGLTVAADGRSSTIRAAAGLRPREFGSGIDVLWFRLPRVDSDPDEAIGLRLAGGRASVVIPRRDYWQVAYLIPKGGYRELQAAGIERLHEGFARTVPIMADRIKQISDWSQVSMLEVRINRLTRWYLPGLLCVGDAAHAMSPVGGVGINLAVQDAAAAANLLTEPLLAYQRDRTPVSTSALAAVERRRRFPAAFTQTFQRFVQRVGVDRTLRAGEADEAPRPPVPAALMPVVRPLLSRLIGLGVRPEHVRAAGSAPPEG